MSNKCNGSVGMNALIWTFIERLMSLRQNMFVENNKRCCWCPAPGMRIRFSLFLLLFLPISHFPLSSFVLSSAIYHSDRIILIPFSFSLSILIPLSIRYCHCILVRLGCGRALLLRVPVGQIETVECRCGHKFCFRCRREDHRPCTCAMYDEWLRLSGGLDFNLINFLF